MNNQPVKSPQSAFTMVEMMVSVLVFIIVLTLAFTTLLAANEVRRAAAARIDIYQNARATLGVVTQELRAAKLRETDTRFSDEERQGLTFTNPNNGRGRFQVNDWPPPKQSVPAGISVTDKRVYLGNGVDDDGDGKTDEEAFDGLDDDQDGEQGGPIHPIYASSMADGLDNNSDGRVDEGIDEDIFYPRDMLNFLTARGNEEIEVGYALDTLSQRDLLRRSASLKTQHNPQDQIDGLYPVAILYEMGTYVPDPATGATVPWFDYNYEPNSGLQDQGEEPLIAGQVRSNVPPSPNITQVYEIMSLNILGLDVKAFYYDYLIAEENSDGFAPIPQILIPSLNQAFSPYSFPALSWDSSFENGMLTPYPLVTELGDPGLFPNEADDLALVENTSLYVKNYEAVASQAVAVGHTRERIRLATNRTDGFPTVVEVTLFVQDQNRLRDDPVRISTRVLLSFGVGSENGNH